MGGGTGRVTVPEPPGPDTVPETDPPWVPTVTEPDRWVGPAQAARTRTVSTNRIAFIVFSIDSALYLCSRESTAPCWAQEVY